MVNRLAHRWWAPVLGIYAASRFVSFLFFLAMASIQEDNFWTKAHPGYFDFLNIWDVEWYHKIYSNGYPSVLPTNHDGTVRQNSWAFYPLFPYLVRAVNFITGIDWKYLAPILATVIGFFFILMAYKLIRLTQTEKVTRWSILLISISVASPILQTGYAESLSLFLFVAALYFHQTRRWWWLAATLVTMSVARPGVIAFGLFFVIMLVYRWYKQKKFSWIEFGFAALSGVLGVLWIVIAWITTGRFDAYLKTEFAWRAGFVDSAGVIPFSGWFESGRFFIGDWLGLVVVVCAIIFFVCLMFFPSVVATGVEMRAWLGAYLFYLFAIFFPQSSTPRILMPAITMMVAFGIATSKFGRFGKAAVVALSLLGQVVWLLICWKYTAPDYTPP